MSDTTQLIEELGRQAVAVKPVQPRRYVAYLFGVLGLYCACIQCWGVGLRPDLAQQWARPWFAMEVLLLFAMLVSAMGAGVYAMVPDFIQRQWLLRAPYLFSVAMLALVLFQLFLPQDSRMVMTHPMSHTHECTLYIALSALLPATLIFALIRRGASVVPLHAGMFAMIASVAIGTITLRLAEANDDVIHLLVWHYVPSIFFAGMGVVMGRLLLRW